MILSINTVGHNEISIALLAEGKIIFQKSLAAERSQAEKLLPLIDASLKKQRLKLADIEGIEVENSGGSFTSLRIGVTTANALGFALGIPVRGTVGEVKNVAGMDIVEPVYDREPDIGSSRNT